MKSIKLTDSQIDDLIEFIELYFITSIREDGYIDNIDYIASICDVFVKLKKAKEEDRK